MNEQEMYAAVGRKQTDLDNLNTEYDRLLSLLAQVVTGAVAPERVTVDLEKRTWALVVPAAAAAVEQPGGEPVH